MDTPSSSDPGPSTGPSLPHNAGYFVIPKNVLAVPAFAFAYGAMTGSIRGSRLAGLRFAAENAHRAPTTLNGWYFYQKTKNYRVILGGLKGGALEGLKLASVGSLYVGIREGGEYAGMQEWSDLAAGLGSGAVVSAIYRLPSRQTGQLLGIGAAVGLGTSLLRKLRGWLGERMEEGKGE